MDNSTLDRYMSNNDVPTALDAQYLRGSLASARDDAASLRTTLRAKEEVIKKLEGALSPMRTFPVEILGEIFNYVVEVPRALDKKGRNMVVTLGLVCKKRRNAALATPQLWANVSICVQSRKDLEMVLAWTERARGCPKTLCSRWVTEHIIKQLESTVRLDHLRLESFDMDTMHDVCRAWHKRKTEGGLWDTLRSLEIVYDQDTVGGFDDPELDASTYPAAPLGYIPPVTSLALHLPPLKIAFADEDILGETANDTASHHAVALARQFKFGLQVSTLERLTSLEITYDWAGDHLGDILKHCKNLESFTSIRSPWAGYRPSFGSPLMNAPDPMAKPPITLPKLKTLRLLKYWNFNFLYRIIAPALTTLDMDFGLPDLECTDEAGALQALKHFVDASGNGATLRTLRLAHAIDMPRAVEFVRPFPSLTKLTFDDVFANYDGIWRSFADGVESDGNRCLSKLREVEMLNVHLVPEHPYAVEPEHFFDGVCVFLQRRTPASSCIVTGSFAWSGAAEDDGRASWKKAALASGRTELKPEEAGVWIRVLKDCKRSDV